MTIKTSWRNASLVVSAVAVMALTTACGGDTPPPAISRNAGATASAGDYGTAGTGLGSSTGGTAGAAGQSSATPSATAPPSAGELSVSTNQELGEVLTDGTGRTLYRFDKDTAEPPKSDCDGDCATTWPPVPADGATAGATAGAGVDEALIGSVTRSDGTKQLSVDGWPAYRYAKDTNAGDATGQAVGGTWYALAPDGKKAKADSGARAADLPGLSTRKDPELGEIVIDRNGMTVYRFIRPPSWMPRPSGRGGNEAPAERGRERRIAARAIRCLGPPADRRRSHGIWYVIRPDGKPVGASEQQPEQ